MNSSKPNNNKPKPSNNKPKPNNNKPKPSNNKPKPNKPKVYNNKNAANLAVRQGKHLKHNIVKYMKNGQEVTGILETKEEKITNYNNYWGESSKYVNVQRIVDERGYIYKNLEAAEKAVQKGNHLHIKNIRFRGQDGKIKTGRINTIDRKETVFAGEMNGYQPGIVRYRKIVVNNK